MANKNGSNITASTSTTAPAGAAAPAPKPARKAARKPPVIERIGLNALVVPAQTAPATAAPAASPAATPAPMAPAPTAPADPAAAASSAMPAATPTASASGDDVTFPVDAPPPVTVPSVPAGFVPINGSDLRGWRPMQSELASVPGTITELGNFPSYTTLLGVTAPPAAQVIARLTVAAEWTTLFAATTAWYQYVKAMEGMAWKDALELTDKLKTPFQLAETTSPTLANQYPNFARLLGARSIAAKRGTSTRSRNKKAAQAAQVAQTAAGATGTEAAPAVPARVVTVQG